MKRPITKARIEAYKAERRVNDAKLSEWLARKPVAPDRRKASA